MRDFLKYNVVATAIIGSIFCFDTRLVEWLTGKYIYADPSGVLFAGLFVIGGWPLIWISGLIPVILKIKVPVFSRSRWLLTSIVCALLLATILWYFGLSPRHVEPPELYLSLSFARVAAVLVGLVAAWWVVAPSFVSEDNKLF